MSQYVCCLDPQTARTPEARLSGAQQIHERQGIRVVSDIAPKTVPVGRKPQPLGMSKPGRPCAVMNVTALAIMLGNARPGLKEAQIPPLYPEK